MVRVLNKKKMAQKSEILFSINLTDCKSICLRFKSNVTEAHSSATTGSSVISRLSNKMLLEIDHNSRPIADYSKEENMQNF